MNDLLKTEYSFWCEYDDTKKDNTWSKDDKSCGETKRIDVRLIVNHKEETFEIVIPEIKSGIDTFPSVVLIVQKLIGRAHKKALVEMEKLKNRTFLESDDHL